MIFGSYFFMSPETLLHTRKAYDFISVLSDFGGILEILIFMLFPFFCKFNEQGLLIKSIRAVYFNEKMEEEEEEKEGGVEVTSFNVKPIKMGWSISVIENIKFYICRCQRQQRINN
jgi:hypothetical protein